MGRTIALCAVFLVAAAVVGCQASTRDGGRIDGKAMNEAERQRAELLPKLVTKKNYREMGFESPGEVRQTKLGEPLPERFIRLDRLRAFQAGQDVAALMQPTSVLLFPLEVDGTTKSSLGMKNVAGKWELASFGGAESMRVIDSARRKFSEERSVPLRQFFIVRARALNFTALGFVEAGTIQLGILIRDARFGFEAGQILPAAAAVTKMVPVARAHDSSAPG